MRKCSRFPSLSHSFPISVGIYTFPAAAAVIEHSMYVVVLLLPPPPPPLPISSFARQRGSRARTGRRRALRTDTITTTTTTTVGSEGVSKQVSQPSFMLVVVLLEEKAKGYHISSAS